MKMPKLAPIACLPALTLTLLLVAPDAARAQAVAVAEISGTVTDPTGSAIVGAQIKVVEVDRQIPHATTSDATGHYVLPNLPVGPYTLEVSANGFKNYLQSGIVLQV